MRVKLHIGHPAKGNRGGLWAIISILLFFLCSLAAGQQCHNGELCLHLSLPHINSFNLHPENEAGRKVNTGFWGVSVGLDYHHSTDQYLQVVAGAVTDIFLPVPAPVDYSGEVEFMNSLYFSFSNNHIIRKFTVGYGLSVGKNTWELRYYEGVDDPPPIKDPVTKTSTAFGFVMRGYYQVADNYYVGIVYRPTVFRFGIEPSFEYEHVISVDFAARIRI